jgi:acyl-CoA synthetase (AMP-forming)/AMP-acid ligase II
VSFVLHCIIQEKASWYRTGDLGVWYDNQLYITGRLKEMIIVHGSKHYPQDVEEVIRLAHPDIRKGGVAAWATQTKNGGGKF